MKLHLPVRLFRAVVALMTAVTAIASIQQVYADTEITYEGYKIEESYPFTEGSNSTGSALYLTGDSEFIADDSISFISNSTLITYNGLESECEYFTEVGGAVYVYYSYKPLTLIAPGNITFRENTSCAEVNESPYLYSLSNRGGAISAVQSDIHIKNAENVNFEANKVTLSYGEDAIESSTYVELNLSGGAIESDDSTVKISNCSDIAFTNNTVEASIDIENCKAEGVNYHLYASGGAISGNVEIIGGDNTVFSENKVTVSCDYTYNHENGSYFYPSVDIYGGAIDGSQIIFSGNGGNLTLSDNYAGFCGTDGYSGVHGGAISVRTYWDGWECKTYSGLLSIENYDSVVFSGNIASNAYYGSNGGAIYGEDYRESNKQNIESLILFSGNNEILFENNYAETGSAIYGDKVVFVDNGDVVFRGNKTNHGTTIDACILIIQNNDSVVFSDNENEYSYSCVSASDAVFSAYKGKSIEFRESFRISNLEVGAKYTDADGSLLVQKGSVILTGAYIDNNGTGIRSESDTYRTFEVDNLALSGGMLSIEDGAILAAQTFDSLENSSAQLALSNAFIRNNAGSYMFRNGTTFSLSGKNKVTLSSLTLCSGSTLSFTLSDINARRSSLYLNGNLDLENGVTFNFSFAEGGVSYRKNALITLQSGSLEDLNWALADIKVNGPEGSELPPYDLYWEGNTLYLDIASNPDYQTHVVYVDDASDMTNVSNAAGDFLFRVQSDVSIAVEDASVMNQTASWHIMSDREAAPKTVSFSTTGARIFDMGDMETLTVEGLNKFAMDSSFINDNQLTGCLLYAENGDVLWKGNSVVSISHNTASCLSGEINGLIYLQNSTLNIEHNELVEFSYNQTKGDSYRVGAVVNGDVNFADNTKVNITYNSVSGEGDYLFGGVFNGDITFTGNSEIIFSINDAYNNLSYERGTDTINVMGGISYGSSIFEKNGNITFERNGVFNYIRSEDLDYSCCYGSLLYGDCSFSENEDIVFSDNFTFYEVILSEAIENYSATLDGGAISGTIDFDSNSLVSFTENRVEMSLYHNNPSASLSCYIRGGAVSGVGMMNQNDRIVFENNGLRLSIANKHASYENHPGFVVGGAILVGMANKFSIVNNGEVEFLNNYVIGSGDYVRVYGGAIYAFGKIAIQDNDSVLFSKNYEKDNGVYRLRSLVIDDGLHPSVALSARLNKTITFEDSLGFGHAYLSDSISGKSDVQFNNVYINDNGEKIAQTGDIIFTGAYTEEHLKEIKGGVAGTAEEILNSRTSEVWALTKLYDGRLRIEDGAIYKGFGLTAFSSASGQSNPTVLLNNASMHHDGYSITLNAGARLELSGTNTISADNMQLNNGAGFVFNVDDTHLTTAALSYTGALTLGGELVICINSEDGLTIGNTYKLMTVTDASATEAMSWDGTHIIIQTGNGLGVVSNDLIWQDNVLYLNYTGTLTINELKLTWLGGKKAVWQNGHETLWENALGEQVVYRDGDHVTFTKDTIEIVGEVQPGSITLAPEKSLTFKTKYDKKAGEWSGSIGGEGISVTIAGGAKGKVTMNDGNTYTGITSIESGTVNAGGATSFGKSSIAITGGSLDLKSKEVANDIELTGSATIKGGKKYLGTFTQTGGELMKGSVLNIVESATISGGTVNGTLSGVGTVTIDGDVALGESGKITTDKLLVDGSLAVSSKGLAMNTKTSAIEINGGKLSSKGKVSAASLNLDGGSLSLSGALSVKDLTLGSGTLTLDGAKLTTVKVGNSLMLEGDTTLNFGFSVKDKDVATGKSYKIFTFKTIDAAITDTALNELLGLGTDAATLAFDTKRKAITLTVTDAEAWNEYAESVRNGTWTATSSEDDEFVESAGVAAASFMLARPAAAVDPMLGKVADTLVQSTWGTAGASRSFGDTIAARGTHATEFANGKAAAWISTMGGSSRISSDGAHAGADYTLTGAAFGMETRLSESSTIGLAIGNSWGKVSTFSAFPVDQDSTHQGIYGKHILGSTTTLSWMAAHTRTESDAKLAGMPCDWTQDALQLDARVDKLFAVSDRTTVSAFVGMQYLATDKGECNGLSTGSLQNLRGEIGVSAAHKATDKAYIYGELSFIGDMVRNNPTATVGDYRSRGANPGRAGLNLSVGASYQLNDSWSLNGSYSLELMQNQTSHSANVGATYSF